MFTEISYNPSTGGNLLICGPTGSGKSVLQRKIIDKFINAQDCMLIFIDTKGFEFNNYSKINNLYGGKIYFIDNEYISLFEQILAEKTAKTRYLIIDELAELLFDDKIKSKFMEVLNKSQEINVVIIATSQRVGLCSKLPNFSSQILL